ncbi:hypothetical protein EH223_00225 [candidate division KSB1 bacterium]|nr:baseplate J/gp47 family protein [candidate division KSB1 bacterium]RQW07346.1 MAG: hypothetical protein EH223_00225 [candidate division KSB1 bacterium]
MISICDVKNPLVRDGSSQRQRLIEALKPENAKIDDRSMADMICFAQRYARELQYYDSANKAAGDWQSFIENDISTIVAQITKKDLNPFKTCLVSLIQIDKYNTHADEILNAITLCFAMIFTAAFEMGSWFAKSVAGLRLYDELERIIASQLVKNLERILCFYKHAAATGLVREEIKNIGDCEDHFEIPHIILDRSFHRIWIPEHAGTSNWKSYVDSLTADPEFFDGDITDQNDLRTALRKLIPFLEIFYGAQQQIVQQAPEFLDETVKEWSQHEPHMALFLAFLQLFQIVQEHLNTLTQRHLDFYYQNVLQLVKKEAEPNKVNLIFELAKYVDSCLLKKDTLLKAGKDATGKEVFYQIDQQTALNSATVSELKTIFIDKLNEPDGTSFEKVYAAPIANSSDGQGGEFANDETGWQTLGAKKFDEEGTPLSVHHIPLAEIGFAIASPLLLLGEGTRFIQVSFIGSLFDHSYPLKPADLNAWLSGEKEWLPANIANVSMTANQLTIGLSLNDQFEPVTEHNAEVLNSRLSTTYPVLKITLNEKNKESRVYTCLKNATISKIEVWTFVGSVQNLIVQNDISVMDANKPFLPFGPQPGINSSFYIGSREIFQKPLSWLKIYTKWKDIPSSNLADYYHDYGYGTINNTTFKAQYSLLSNKSWRNLGDPRPLFDATDAQATKVTLFHTDLAGVAQAQSEVLPPDLTEYKMGLGRGFLRLQLSEPPKAFGHASFRDVYTKAVIAYAKDPIPAKAALIPNEPYTPQIEQITLQYLAGESRSFPSETTSSIQFFHVLPYGVKKVANGANARLLAPFTIKDQPSPLSGQLFIGLDKLKPPQNLSLLFQMSEGSANPLREKQQVYWQYLSDNEWKEFENNKPLSDTTNGLLTSGIVTFAIPKDATKENSVLPAACHWIRASVQEFADAVCDTVAIHAQAAQASFIDLDNDPNFLAQRLPAGTISKLKVTQAEIKAVEQKYASFAGRTKEQDQAFYTRVSERLRHKNRGIAIWDYEKLILEQFPSIYKVKCINHSTYFEGKNNPESMYDSEFAPGYITIIVIPDVKNMPDVNALEPRASINMREEIRQWLSCRMSPFAARNLKVLNPLYEKITLDFKVEFLPGYDFNLYRNILEQDLKEYLSPWAFEGGRDIDFGGSVHKSVLLNFVEERPYVDYVSDFKMLQSLGKLTAHITAEITTVEETHPTTARSVFVSNSCHRINQLANDSVCKLNL